MKKMKIMTSTNRHFCAGFCLVAILNFVINHRQLRGQKEFLENWFLFQCIRIHFILKSLTLRNLTVALGKNWGGK